MPITSACLQVHLSPQNSATPSLVRLKFHSETDRIAKHATLALYCTTSQGKVIRGRLDTMAIKKNVNIRCIIKSIHPKGMPPSHSSNTGSKHNSVMY
jgi:hypothetical protein